MRTNPQRAAHAATKLTITSYATFHPGLSQAQQVEPGKTLEEVTVSAHWLGPPAPETARKHPGALAVITNQELTESGARDRNRLRSEVTQ